MPEFSAGDPADLQPFLSEDDYIAAFQVAYIECALWSGVQNDEEDAEVNDARFDQLSAEAITELCTEAEEFVKSNIGLLISHAILRGMRAGNGDLTLTTRTAAVQAGHDFWLTRNRHGAGFWDRGDGDLGDKLTEASHPYGETFLYLDDEGVIGHN